MPGLKEDTLQASLKRVHLLRQGLVPILPRNLHQNEKVLGPLKRLLQDVKLNCARHLDGAYPSQLSILLLVIDVDLVVVLHLLPGANSTLEM
jgi:hypothetical protein